MQTLPMKSYFFVLSLSLFYNISAQVSDFISYDKKTYEVQSITVSGNQFSDANAIIAISGLKIGQKVSVPGTEIPQAIKALYRQKLFSQVEIEFDEIRAQLIKINIKLTEKPRYSTHSFKGVKKSAHDELNELFNSQINKNTIVTDDVKENIIYKITEHFVKKGYLDAKVKIHEVADDKQNKVRLVVDINRSKRVKIGTLKFEGNKNISDRKLRKKMKETKLWTRIFSKSKYVESLYEEDKQKVLDYYYSKGYRDVNIISDSVFRKKNGKLGIIVNISEGNKYYYRIVKIKGNSLFSEDQIKKVININRGDVYNQELLQKRLSFSQDGRDVSSLYMDDGYLFFRAEPVETGIEKDSVDVEVRIFEGPQATIDKVIVAGNDRTHENVIRRELRTRPGQKFSRSDIIRSQRAIMALGFFNPETMGINTPVNPKRGTVDIEYKVEERPSDQLELSAGYSAIGLVGTLGVVFNNFSTKNIFKKESWSPLPQGDGQKLSLRAQTNGKFFQSYNFSFTEPWLGNKKPNSFTLGAVYSLFNNPNSTDPTLESKFSTFRISSALGSQLQWPDDNFSRVTALNLERIRLKNYPGFNANNQNVNNGEYYNISLRHTIARSTINDPLFPRSGSRISLSCQLTPPYSIFRKNYNPDSVSVEERYKLVEYHKWRFDGEFYFNLVNKLVLSFNSKMGFVGYYNKKLGASPFERFRIGGDGLSNQNIGLAGRDILALRGYEDVDVQRKTIDPFPGPVQDGTIFNKFTIELRYPLSLNPSATIYATTFFQAGNQWTSFKEYNPFLLKRSAGVGLRVFLPMFGLLGFDYGFGIDKPWLVQDDAPLKSYGRFSLILGFEPD
ncbi:MAG: outer membrane protein assembly factor BamA [Saprospiraceae bacterium]|nr:outer membrane protein assembly factor BamA [Saprospiraceae bacterium]